MNPMVFIPVVQIGQFGAMLLLAGSLLAALLGIIAFVWAMVLVWRENNPQGIIMRGHGRLVVDVDEDDPVPGKGPKEKLLEWVGR
jgi:hypothetical protein